MSTFSRVIVVGEAMDTPMFEQAEARLVRIVAESPRYRVTADVEITTQRSEQLPAQTKEAVEPVIWSLQERFGGRGGEWQVDFYDPLGFSFMVVYLE